MIILKEEFKVFVRKKPELIKYVTNGEMTWQKFYELWSLYGEDNAVWDKYNQRPEETRAATNTATNKEETFSFSSLVDSIKKVDMNSVQKGINSMQKAIELLQGLTTKGAASAATEGYKPRQLFKKFED